MGKITGFLEYDRQTDPAEQPLDRIEHWKEFHPRLSEADRRQQGARCMECGVPFCQSGATLGGMTSGCPLHNLVPEWNDLLYTGNLPQALERDAVALFPDAPTLRGLKHVEELITLRGRGYAAAAVFLIQMEGVRCFTPNTGAQPEFHRALCRAREAGVQLLAFRCRVRPDEVEVLAPVEVRL